MHVCTVQQVSFHASTRREESVHVHGETERHKNKSMGHLDALVLNDKQTLMWFLDGIR